ncbi:sphingosine kinase 1-like [Pollicipes pollicipes]|uniref:sphingosine kinase 1-like n=1 Tax=Pollicipes pollicipes TaxID=41117 RepID=UPI0018858842|nr:sphingosine kinase 1-like [Pollicipes pollicipes]
MSTVEEEDGLVIREQFSYFTKPKVQCRITITQSAVSVENLSTRLLERIDATDIIGCHCMRPKGAPGHAADDAPRPTAEFRGTQPRELDAYICIYAYTCKKRSDGAAAHFKRRSHIFRVGKKATYEANLRLAAFWRTLVLCVARGVRLSKATLAQAAHVADLIPSRKPMLILINPKSGPGHALQVFRQRVLPILSESDVAHDVVVTSRAGEARQLAAEQDLGQWSAVVIVSGDGLLYEVYNGIMSRPDWDAWVDFPVALVPAGSGNGMAASVAHACGLLPAFLQNPVLTSSLGLAKRLELAMDLMMVQTETEELVGFLSLGWGLLADIDIESERLRVLGGARFSLWAAARVLTLRTYRGRIHYLSGQEEVVRPGDERRVERPRLERAVTIEGSSSEVVGRKRPASESVTGQGDGDAADDGVFQELMLDQVPTPDMQARRHRLSSARDERPPIKLGIPSLDQPPPDTWSCIEGEFVLVYGSLPSHISGDMHLNPGARLDDGLLHLHVIRAGATRAQVFQYLLGLGDGRLTELSFVEVYPVRAVRLVPETPSGYITLDGEVVHYGPVQAEVHRGLGRVLCPRMR